MEEYFSKIQIFGVISLSNFASNFLFCSYDTRIYFNNLLPVLSFLLIVLFCVLLRKCSLIWITLHAKLRLGRFCHAISSLFYVFILIYYLQGCNSLILLNGHINTNPGPTASSQQCFSICHWKLNSDTAHNLAKLSLLTAYNQVHSFDIICLSDTYLNFNIEEVLVFITNRSFLEMNLGALSTNNRFLTVMTGDFNGKSNNWYF